jgi:D-glycero-alpha-D-manno-heptose 1-phosphate guanylyltransferase
MSYDAIILAGGLGTRLRETVPDLPKPLAFVNGRPFLDILIEQIECSGLIRKLVLALGYKAEAIVDYYEKKDFKFSIEKNPLGTGGAIAKAIKHTKSSQVFVFNGDSFFACPLKEMIQAHRGVLTLACAKVDDTSAYGRVELDKENQVKQFNEKGIRGSGLINGGIYLFDRTVFDKTLPKTFSLEHELIPRLINKGITGFISNGIFIDIGTKESYHKAQTILGNR